MSRDLDSTQLGQVRAPTDRRCFLVRIEVPSGTLLLTTHTRNVQWDGDVYGAVGALGDIGELKESADIVSNPMKLTLRGLDNSVRDVAEQEFYQGAEVQIYQQFLDNDDVEVGEPLLYWEGFLDTLDIVQDEFTSLEAQCENWMTEWDQPRRFLYSSEDQKENHSTDRFFDYVPQLEYLQVVWGGAPVSPASRGVGGSSWLTNPPPNFQFGVNRSQFPGFINTGGG